MSADNKVVQIERIAQNARTTWFGLLALLVFIGVTLMGHNDANFFAYGAATELPLVGIKVPPTAFFVAAPILTAAFYCYLHVYLLSLWEALGSIEQSEACDAESLSVLVYPSLFTIAGLWWRNKIQKDGSMGTRVLGRWTIATALALGWGFGIVILALLFWLAHAEHNYWTAVIGAISLWAAVSVGGVSLRAAHLYLSGRPEEVKPNTLHNIVSIEVLLLLLLVSIARVESNDYFPSKILASAQLERASITIPSHNWPEYPIWRRQFEAEYRELERKLKENATEMDDPIAEWPPGLQAHFLDRLQRNWVVDVNSVGRRDLSEADLRGANLVRATMIGAVLREADLSGANLTRARLQGAVLRGVNMEGATLTRAKMQGVYFEKTEDAEPVRPNLRRAILARVRFDDGYLNDADLQGANLWKAKLPGTDVNDWDITGASLRNADLSSARNLDPSTLETAFGDFSTKLPAEYDRPCHWNTLPLSLEDNEDFPSLFEDIDFQDWLATGAKAYEKLFEGRCPNDHAP